MAVVLERQAGEGPRSGGAGLAPSWYEASAAHERVFHPPLESSDSTDVCVVGGGFAGLHTALGLAEEGRQVTLLEAHRIAWGASGRNGGQVIPEFACGRDVLRQALGRADGDDCWRLATEGAARLRTRIARHGIDCDYTAGHLEVAVSARRFARLRHAVGPGVDTRGLRLVEREELRTMVGSPLYHGGLFNPDGGHLHPVKLALGLARALVGLGAKVHESTPVLAWRRHGQVIRVECQGGRHVDCRQLVLGANVGVREIEGPAMGRLASRIIPVGTWVIASAPLAAELADHVLPSRVAVADNRMVMDYFRLSRDNRLIFGGGCSYLGAATPPGFADQLRARMIRVFPQLSDTAVDYAWGGTLDISMNRAPDVGTLEDDGRVIYAQGFSGSGLVATCAVGAALCATLQGEPRAFDLLRRIPHRRFPGGKVLRAPITAAGMLYHRILDQF